MNLVQRPLSGADASLPEIPVRCERRKLARRLWRGAAADGAEFGFEGDVPLQDGDVVGIAPAGRYVIRQEPEPVLEIPLDVSPEAAAVIGWAVGNLHFAVESQPGRLLAPDDPGLRQALDRMAIHFHETVEVFRPHRFAGSLAGHGHSHSHDESGHGP